jgi:hypothetical protein
LLFFSIDVYTCKAFNPAAAIRYTQIFFDADRIVAKSFWPVAISKGLDKAEARSKPSYDQTLTRLISERMVEDLVVGCGRYAEVSDGDGIVAGGRRRDGNQERQVGVDVPHGISHTTVREIGRAFGLNPGRWEDLGDPRPPVGRKIRDRVARGDRYDGPGARSHASRWPVFATAATPLWG